MRSIVGRRTRPAIEIVKTPTTTCIYNRPLGTATRTATEYTKYMGSRNERRINAKLTEIKK